MQASYLFQLVLPPLVCSQWALRTHFKIWFLLHLLYWSVLSALTMQLVRFHCKVHMNLLPRNLIADLQSRFLHLLHLNLRIPVLPSFLLQQLCHFTHCLILIASITFSPSPRYLLWSRDGSPSSLGIHNNRWFSCATCFGNRTQIASNLWL